MEASSSAPSSVPSHLTLFKLISEQKYGEAKMFLATPEGATQAKQTYRNCTYGRTSRSSVTMLHHALYTFKEVALASLFEDCFEAIYHAFPEAAHKMDNSGYLPIHAASIKIKTPLNIFKFLFDKDPSTTSQRDNSGNLPTHYICSSHTRHPSKFVPLFELFSLPKLGEEGREGNLPIHFAATAFNYHDGCSSAAVVYLARRFRAGLLHQNKSGCCPLHLVTEDTKFGELAKLYPDCLNVRNNRGETPLASYLAWRSVPKCRIAVIQSVVSTIAAQNTGKVAEKDLQDCQARLTASKAAHDGTKAKLKSVSRELALRNEIAAQDHNLMKTTRDMLLASDATPIETIKLIASSTKAQLDLLKANLKPDSKPSMVQLMFDSFIKDPNVEKPALTECIEHMVSEVNALEQQLSSGAAPTEDESTGADSSGPKNKRARVSVS